MIKDLCRKCIDNRCSLDVWDELDEKQWKNGSVFCVHRKDLKISDGPPKNCYYALEHITLDEGNLNEDRDCKTNTN